MSSTVYVTNRSPEHDYSSAAKFGAVRFVTIGNYPVFKTNRLRTEIIETLVHSHPDDYLLVSGSAIIAAISMAVWLELHPRLKLLIYSRGEGVYIERNFGKADLRLEIERARDAAQAD